MVSCHNFSTDPSSPRLSLGDMGVPVRSRSGRHYWGRPKGFQSAPQGWEDPTDPTTTGGGPRPDTRRRYGSLDASLKGQGSSVVPLR